MLYRKEGIGVAGLKLYKVVALRAHNTTKGRKKASDRVISVLGSGAIQVKDVVEGHGEGGRDANGRSSRVPGIKCILSVERVGIRDLGRLGDRDAGAGR